MKYLTYLTYIQIFNKSNKMELNDFFNEWLNSWLLVCKKGNALNHSK